MRAIGDRVFGINDQLASILENKEKRMPGQAPSIGRVVHFVYGDQHHAAIITAVHSRLIEGEGAPQYGQTLFVMPPMDAPFSTVAAHDPACAPGTWHWPEHVPAAT